MKTAFVLGATLLASLVLMNRTAHAEVQIGDEVPEFKLVGSDGKTYTSEQFKGKQAIVIAWFPKAFTGGCTKECKSMREQGETLKQFDVAYFTASCDAVKKNMDFAASLDLDYPILSDPDKTFAKALGCLSPRGVSSRWTYYIGKDGKILHIDKSVKTETHGADIAAQLETLGIAKKQ
ncbi:Putative peroxiredoxin bcp [Rosistilla carotiformis]|uniref:Peroxiredoxin bcp n=1 Tax=Rosistilla carotiformis TaxID=2528017 RepID=A0A518JPC5_9BACT|nr:redoxin domain-containing protein [Rosistilla carotiformis]QDV67394.1 Putative peroxiredoxin bcp [Rosistilla carotiformis]